MLLVLTLLWLDDGGGLGGGGVCGLGIGRGWDVMERCHGKKVEVGDCLVAGGCVGI